MIELILCKFICCGDIKVNILIFGSDGFIGRNVANELAKNTDNNVFRAMYQKGSNNPQEVIVDLLSEADICQAIATSQPQVIINCAGVVDVSSDVSLNAKFTENIIHQAAKFDCTKTIIISGSAAEYGKINDKDLPVDENTPLRANTGYGYSKLTEEKIAHKLQRKYQKNVIVLRIFNPIGKGMSSRFLAMELLRQTNEIKNGLRKSIDISRLDSKRDYVSVKDLARAFRVVTEDNPIQKVYNVGSGIATSNGQLLELILKGANLDTRPLIQETSVEPEALVACQADITRISKEFGWKPEYNLERSVREIING